MQLIVKIFGFMFYIYNEKCHLFTLINGDTALGAARVVMFLHSVIVTRQL